MMAIPRSLLLRFTDDMHTFAPDVTSTTAYGWFNDTVVPALEHLEARGYVRIDERVPNALFSPGGRWAAFTCRLTPTGRAARALLVERIARRADAHVHALTHAPAAVTATARQLRDPASEDRREASDQRFG